MIAARGLRLAAACAAAALGAGCPAPGAPPGPAPSPTPAAAAPAWPPVDVPTIRAVFPLPAAPLAGAALAGRPCFVLAGGAGLAVVEPFTGELRQVPLDGARADALVPFPDGRYALVPDPAGRRVLVVDPTATPAVVQAVALDDAPGSLAVAPDGGSAVVALAGGAMAVLGFGPDRTRPPSRKAIPRAGAFPAGAALAFDGERVVAPTADGKGAAFYDVATGAATPLRGPTAWGPVLLTAYESPPKRWPVALARDGAGGITIDHRGIDSAMLPVDVGGEAGFLANVPELGWAYATLPAAGEAVAVDYLDRGVAGRVKVGKRPGRVWIEPAAQAPAAYALLHGGAGGREGPGLALEAWVSNDGDDTVSVFDADGAIPGVTHLPVGGGRKHMAFTPGDAWVGSEGAATLTRIQRPAAPAAPLPTPPSR